MDGRIGQLECQYRIIPQSARSFTQRLDRIARQDLGRACAQKLDAVLGSDPAVWMIRRISVDLLFHAQADRDDSQIASRWAARIMTAALQEAAKGADGQRVVRFADQAHLVTQFLTDLLHGDAWDKWYYGCFRRWAGHPVGAVALAVLLENQEHLAPILARLSGAGLLDTLWSEMGTDALAQLWKAEAGESSAALGKASLRPIFFAAVSLLQSGGVEGQPGRDELDRWLGEYAASSPAAVDWRDRAGLAWAVVEAIEFLRRRGHRNTTLATLAKVVELLRARTATRQSLDWLDTELLEQELGRRMRAEEAERHPAALEQLFATALHLAEPRPDQNQLLRMRIAPWLTQSGFAEFARSARAPLDWANRSQLATAVVAALEFLWERGLLTKSVAEVALAWQEPADPAGAGSAELDQGLLEACLLRLRQSLLSSDPTAKTTTLAAFSPASLLRPEAGTPRRRRLMNDLAQAMAMELPALARYRLDGPGNALRVYARLVALDAAWSGDSMAQRAIEELLAAASWMSSPGPAWFDEATDPNELWPELWPEASPAGRADTPQQPPAEVAATSFNPVPKQGDEKPDALLSEVHDAVRQRGWAALASSTFPARIAACFGQEAAAAFRRLCLLDALRPRSSGPASPTASPMVLEAEPSVSVPQANPAASVVTKPQPRASAGGAVGKVLLAADRPQTGSRPAAQFLRAFGETGLDLAVAIATGMAAAARDRGAELAEGVDSRCAGVFLMIRAMVDARLASAVDAAGLSLEAVILTLGLYWAGAQDAIFDGRLDAGITLLAAAEDDRSLYQLQKVWQETEHDRLYRLQESLLRTLTGQAVVSGSQVAVYRLPLAEGRRVVALGYGSVWPLGRVVTSEEDEPKAIADMLDSWRSATGQNPVLETAEEDSALAFARALEAIGSAPLNSPEAELTLALCAISLLRLWAFWLRQFAGSSTPYLLRNFVRRPGRIMRVAEGLVVELAARPLDIVLSMAGYLATFEARAKPWSCRIFFRIQEPD